MRQHLQTFCRQLVEKLKSQPGLHAISAMPKKNFLSKTSFLLIWVAPIEKPCHKGPAQCYIQSSSGRPQAFRASLNLQPSQQNGLQPAFRSTKFAAKDKALILSLAGPYLTAFRRRRTAAYHQPLLSEISCLSIISSSRLHLSALLAWTSKKRSRKAKSILWSTAKNPVPMLPVLGVTISLDAST